MSFELLAPFGLAALAALALPVIVHLIRRLELRTTEFAAMRWISGRVRPRRRIRIERPWLLLVRLLLLALLALLLARPAMTGVALPAQPWVVVVPGVDRAAARAAVTASDRQWHWLEPDFPALDNAPSSTPIALASLLRQLDMDVPAATGLTVVVPDHLTGLDGERLRLRHAIDWRVVPGTMQEAAAPHGSPIRFAVRYTPDAEASVAYLRAAVAAWNVDEPGRYELDAQAVAAPIAADTRWLAWLAPNMSAQASTWIEDGGTALIANHALPDAYALWRDPGDRALAREQTTGRGRVIAVPGALDPAALPLLLDPDFPARLRAALQGRAAPPTRALAQAARPLHADAASAHAARSPDSIHTLDPWLVLLIALVFLLERTVATRARAQEPA